MAHRSRLLISVYAIAALLAVAWLAWLWIRPPLFEVDGRSFETRIAGSGTPAVVFESGFTGGWYLWFGVQREVSRYAKTLVYERGGLGRSTLAAGPRTAAAIVVELRALLKASGIEPPYVLVGHSAGAMYMRVFAHRYPEEVAAIVLIDPATEDFYRRMRAEPVEVLEPLTRRMSPGLLAQWNALPASLDETSAAWPLPDVPVHVIRASQPLGQWPLATADDVRDFSASQRQLLSRLPNANDIVVEDADHMTILRAPDVTDAIRSAWEAARATVAVNALAGR